MKFQGTTPWTSQSVSQQLSSIMGGPRILLIVVGLGICLGVEDHQIPRSPRTLARFFGLESNAQAQQTQTPQPLNVQAQPINSVPRKQVPLIYSVKYYDRTGEGDKLEVLQDPGILQDRVQGVPARVFLNLYTGQHAPVYYDHKGQVLVPCPVNDHLYVAGIDQSTIVRKPFPPKVVQTPVVAPSSVPVPQASPDIVYYATPSYVPTQIHQKPGPGVGLTVVGVPYEYPFYPGVYPLGGGAFNPYVYLKPSPANHPHVAGLSSGPGQPPISQVDKKEIDKII